ncbi:MAG: glycosyltransferase family 2 protein [Candidatus Marinimicrobia bacterium]|nr:glycosyltransferase family 2 protein [Candidatus Neomarinimicrobiota bacterium]
MNILSIIIVNFNVGKYLDRCLHSVFNSDSSLEFEVIVIDNASTDDSLVIVPEEYPRVHLIKNEKNVGFATACNQGIRKAKGTTLLLLNPDTELQPDTLKEIQKFLLETSDAGVVGCKLLDREGKVQQSARSFPTLGDYLFHNLYLMRLFPTNKLFGRYYLTNRQLEHPEEVDMVIGAFFMIRRELLDQIGLLDEQFFIYAEEREFCMRAKAAGWKVYYNPLVSATHIGGISARQQAPEMFIEQCRSTLLLHQKHDVPFTVGYVRGSLIIGVIIRYLMWSIGSIVKPSKDSYKKQRVYAVAARWLLMQRKRVMPRLP